MESSASATQTDSMLPLQFTKKVNYCNNASWQGQPVFEQDNHRYYTEVNFNDVLLKCGDVVEVQQEKRKFFRILQMFEVNILHDFIKFYLDTCQRKTQPWAIFSSWFRNSPWHSSFYLGVIFTSRVWLHKSE